MSDSPLIAETAEKRKTDARPGSRSALAGDKAQRGHASDPTSQCANLPELSLPYDRPRTAVSGFEDGSLRFAVAEDIAAPLAEMAQREGVSLAAVLLAAFQALLFRYTGQEQFALAVALHDDSKEQAPKKLDLSLAMIRCDCADDPSFMDLVQRSRAALGDARSVFPLSFASAPANGNGSKPPAQVGFEFEGRAEAGGANGQPGSSHGHLEAPSEVRIALQAQGSGILGRIDYNAALFEASTIERMTGHFHTLLGGIVANPNQHVSRLPLVSESEKVQILEDWNDTETDYPRHLCLHQVIEAQADRTPDTIAAEYQGQSLTYQELDARANQLARYLQQLGVGADDRVGVCLKPTLELPVALLAILKAGGACVPLDPSYPKSRLSHMLKDSRAPVLLTDSDLLSESADPGTKVVNLLQSRDTIARQKRARLVCSVNPTSIAYVIYTSGSTGTPKGVLLTHRGLVNHGTAAVKLYGHQPSDRVLQFSSISFDIAVEEFFPTWMCGANVVLRPEGLPLQGSEFLRWVRENRITVLDLPTAYWHELVHELADRKDPQLGDLRLVIVGGEKASATAFATWKKIVRQRVRWVNTYGPTEASVIATFYEPNADPDAPVPANLPIGRPIANVKIYLLDPNLNLVPAGVPGELHIGGIGLARGYLGQPERTAEKFIPDPFSRDPETRLYKTGDLARYLPSGEIEFAGRCDFQVKIRGFRVEPGEIEAVLAKHPSLRDVVVVAQESGGDKRLVAYFVPVAGKTPSSGELRDFLSGKLPPFMVPAVFVRLDAMPLTPNGKVDRKALPPAGVQDTEPLSEDAKPKDALELQLTEIWESVLRIRPIGIQQNFFDLGGHSLLAVRLMHRIEQALGRKLPMTVLFEAPSIAEMASVLRQDSWSPSWSSLVPIQPRGSRPAFFCVHGIGGTVLRFRDLAVCLGEDQPFYGVQAIGLDGKETCPPTIEEMATAYLREIRQVQPEGPYYFGGYSFGGMVALEMADQLRAQGQETIFIGLFDTFPGKPKSQKELLIKLMRLPWSEKIVYLSWKIGHMARFVQRRFGKRLPPDLVAVRKALIDAEMRYVPKVYPKCVTVFNAAVKSLRSEDDPAAGWSEWASGVEIHQIAGHHANIFFEPNVSILAEKLSACLRKAEEAYKAGQAVRSL